jgi:DNA-binding MarR family transcriptional regulator
MDRRTDPDEIPPERDEEPVPTPAGIRLGTLEHYIGFHLRQAQNASFRAFKGLAGDPELRPGWFAVLTLIDANPGITPAMLSRASGRDKSTLTPVLRDLTHRNLIRRMPVEGDKRSYALALTQEGHERLKALSAHAAEHDRKLDAIAGADKPLLLDLLRRIALLND